MAIKSNEQVTLDIVVLIENNPVTRLNGVYQNKMLQRIKEKFTEDEQKMFVTCFYCYLHYNQKTDFIIDLDNVWKWVGFGQKVKAKILLEKHFLIDKDYKVLLSHPGKQDSLVHGGHNKETFMLNIFTFTPFNISNAEFKWYKIISKRKCIHETNMKRFEMLGINKKNE